MVLLQNLGLDTEKAVEKAAHQVCAARSARQSPGRSMLDGLPFQTTASIGVAVFHGDEAEVDDLLKRADLAMYEAKTAGRAVAALLRAGDAGDLERGCA